MLLSNIRTFVERLFYRVVKRARKDRRQDWRRRTMRSCQVEQLEDRTLLSTYTVSNLLDDGSAGTLRTAVIEANANPGEDRIEFSAGADGTILLTSGELEITDDLVIAGNGAGTNVIDGNNASRVFNATLSTGNVSFSGVTIQHGSVIDTGNPESFSGGGGIQFVSSGQLTLIDSTVTGNQVSGDFIRGGGIFAKYGTVTLQSSTISSNDTSGKKGFGGGIFAYSANLTMVNSTISDNRTVGRGANGGGVYMGNGILTASNSSFRGNSADDIDSAGGGIYAGNGEVNLDTCTVDGNSTHGPSYTKSTDGAGIKSLFAAVTIANSTVSGNRAGNGENLGQGGAAGVSVGFAPGSLTVINSTISGNTTEGTAFYGVGLSVNNADMLIVNSTVAYNRSYGIGQSGAGVCSYNGGNITIRNSIVATNFNYNGYFNYAPPFIGLGDVSAADGLTITSSLIGNNNGISGAYADTGLTPDATTHNLIGTQSTPIDPLLGPLDNNGGPTKTMALLAGSPATDLGDDSLAFDAFGSPMSWDQRGSGYNRIEGAAVDMGAFEIQPIVAVGDLQVAGLQFHAVGGTFSTIGNSNTFSGEVQVGFIPAGADPFVPLAALHGSITVDTSSLNFSATGSVVEEISGHSNIMFTAGLTNVSITDLLNSGVAAAGASALSVAGATFTLDSFSFSSTSGPAIRLQGTAVLPKGITLAIAGSNFVDIDTSGVSLNGATFTLENTFSIGGTTFSTTGLTANYTVAGNVFAITGQAGVTVTDLGGLTVNFNSTGLVINDGVFSSLDATVNGTFTTKSVAFTPSNLHFTYSDITQQFNFSGDAQVAIGGMSPLSVTFGHVQDATHPMAVPGLVVTAGALTSLDMTVNSTFTVSAVTVTAANLELTYDGASQKFGMLGTASVAVSGMSPLSVDLGHVQDATHPTAVPGLVVTAGALTSLDMTVNSTFTVSSVTITANNLELTYDAASQKFGMLGTASVAIGGMSPLAVNFGHVQDATHPAAVPGLVVTAGALTSLDMTVNSNFTVSSVTVTATNLELTYAAATQKFGMLGTASATINGMSPLTVTLGHVQDATHPTAVPGLVVTNGALTSLDMTVNSTFTVSSVTITATNLELTYDAAAQKFGMIGTASATIGGMSPLTVTFGHVQDATHPTAVPGLVVTNGSLTSLDMTVNSTFTVASVTITATNLELTYDAASQKFGMIGTASVAIGGMGTLTAMFGHVQDASHPTAVPGLVVTAGVLTSLDLTVNSTFTVSSVTITATNLELTYDAASQKFGMIGTASVAIGGMSPLTVAFGHVQDATHPTAVPGLVVTNGTLTSLDMTVNSSFTVSSVTMTANNLELTYAAASQQFGMLGTASVVVTNLGTLNVTFGHVQDATHPTAVPGLVVTAGALTSLDMTVNSNFTVSAVTVTATNLELTYAASTQKFGMIGTASVTINGMSPLTVTFGHVQDATHPTAVPGLVVTNGALTSLDMTVNSTFTVAGVTVSATNLELTYDAASQKFGMIGAASVAIGGMGTLSVMFGHVQDATHPAAVPGLVVTSGALASLDMTVNSTFTVSSVTVTATNLELTYDAASQQFGMLGTASVTIGGMSTLSVKFGHVQDATHPTAVPGLVVTNGALTSLDMTVNSTFTVAAVTFTATNLELTYDAASQKFAMTGDASVAITNLGTLAVKFGHAQDATHPVAVPGLVVTAGALTSLDMTLTSNFTVGAVTITATNLELTYTAATQKFDMIGYASVAITNLGTLAVKFGHVQDATHPTAVPGLVVTAGALTSLDMTLTSNFTVGSVTITATNLELTYVAATQKFDMTGDASVAITNLGTLAVKFGHVQDATHPTAVPGLVVTAGALTSLDMTLNSNFTVGSVTITATNLELTYSAATQKFDMTGAASVTITNLGTLAVKFGHVQDATHPTAVPGLVVTNGSLTSLDMTVNSNFTVGSVTITATNLELTYTAATQKFDMTGAASVTITNLGTLAVKFGHVQDATHPTAVPGLVVTAGALTSLDMTVNTNFTVGAVTITATNLELTYTAATQKFDMTGAASVTITNLGTLAVKFGHVQDATHPAAVPGLVVTAGALTSLDMTVNSNFSVGGVTITATNLELVYTAATQKFDMKGDASVAIKSLGTLAVKFGHKQDATHPVAVPGLVVTNGALTSLDMTLNSNFTVGSVTITATNLELIYTAATQKFDMTGDASVTITNLGTLAVKFGHKQDATHPTAVPGLVVTNGALTSLDMTLNSNFTVGSVTITATNLELIYTAATQKFEMTGEASVAITNLGNLAVKFGHVKDATHPVAVPGLVVTNGALTSLDMTLTSSFTVGSVTVTATNLELIYTAATQKFEMTGEASVAITNLGNLAVKFGHVKDATHPVAVPGLVVTNGALTSLDMTVTSNFIVGKVTIATKDLELIYTAATAKFSMTGTASVTVGGMGTFSVTMGHIQDATHPAAVPGLVVTNGALTSLNMTVTSSITMGGLTFKINDLTFSYVQSTQKFSMSGGAGVTAPSIGDLSVTFGYNGQPGLVIANGALESLDMTLNSGFKVFGVTVTATNLRFAYNALQNTFSIPTGTISIKTAGNSPLTLNATFGTSQGAGLVIKNGTLTDLHMAISGGFKVGSFAITARSLTLDYTSATKQLGISGGADIALGPLAAGVTFNRVNGKYGIEINTATGAVFLNSFSAAIDVNLGGGTRFKGTFSYDGINRRYSASGTVPVPYINGTVTAAMALHESGTTLVLDRVTVTYDSNGQTGLSIGSTGIYLTHLSATLSNLGTNSLSFYGDADFNYGGTISVGSKSYTFLEAHVNIFIGPTAVGYVFIGDYTFDLAEGYLAHGSGNLNLNFTYGKYSLSLNFGYSVRGIAVLTINLGMAFNGYGTLGLRGTISIRLDDDLPFPIDGYKAKVAGFLYNHANGDPDTYGKGLYLASGWADFGWLGIAGLQMRLNNPKSWAVIHTDSVKYYGQLYKKITDGPIAGALIFADANGNYLFDEGEASTTTDASGRYDPTALSADMLSPVVAIGGIDISTGLLNYAIYSAPSDSLQVNPLTTAVNEMLRLSTDKSEEDIRELASTLLGIATGINVLEDDLIGMVLAGDVPAALAFAKQIQLANVATMIANTLASDAGLDDDDVPLLTTVVYRTLAARLLENPQPIDLTDSATLTELLNASAQAAGVTISPAIVVGAGTVIANINDRIADIPVTGTFDYLNQVAAVQIVAQGLFSTQLAEATAGTIDGLVASSTGTNLTNLIAAVQVGEWQAPALSIADQAAVIGGSGTSSTYTFTVERDSTVSPLAPVSINYATTDGTAIAANGDYTATQGTLTWAPGELGAKTITVQVAGGAAGQAAKQFYVELSNPQNATLDRRVAAGIVVYGNSLNTTTTLSRVSLTEYDDGASTTDTQQGIGLRAVVRDAFGHIVPGFVKFSNADGTYNDIVAIDPDTGTASTNTVLPVGVNEITATYLGFTAGNGGDVIADSVSPVIVQTVTKANQSIDFPGYDDVTYGTVPLFLRAAATSDLQVSYRVVSGPATVDGELLHITGAGTVVVEATQDGDENFNAATPVRQTFNVIPATLTFTPDDQSIDYGDDEQELTGSFSGFVNGDGIGSITTEPTLTIDPNSGDAGDYVIRGSGGQASNYQIQYLAGTLSVVQASTLVTLDPIPEQTVYGQPVTFTATVANAEGTGTPTGMVSFYDFDVLLDTVPLMNVSASLVRSDLGGGTHAISVKYEGNTNFAAHTSDSQVLTVTQAGSVITLEIPNNPAAAALTVTARVAAATPGPGTPTGQVTFLNGNTIIQVVTLTNGAASITIGAGVASQLTVHYAGDAQFLPSLLEGQLSAGQQVAVSLNVSPEGNLVIGTSSTLSVQVTPLEIDDDPVGMVQFLDGTTVLDTVPVVDRTASFTTSLNLGQHTLTAVFIGDDGFQASSNAVLVKVNPVDDFAPVFTSPTAFDVNENSSAVGTVSVTDADVIPQTVTYKITGGADAARFSLSSGILTFSTPADFENPADADANNTYELAVTADDGAGLTTVQNIVITVKPVNDNAPVFATAATFSVEENSTAVETVGATDADMPAQSISYSISGGADAGRFAMTSAGVLSFLTAPDYDHPQDTNTNNVYEVQVTANDGNGNTTVQNIQVSVTPVADNPPAFTTAATFTVTENQTAIGTLVATDADLAPETVTYRISGGADAIMFRVSSNGVLTFASGRDFDAPTDADLNNAYELQVTADDNNGQITTQNLTITVTPLNDNSPEFTTGASFSVEEAHTAVGTVGATDADLPAQNLQFSITGGADASRFSITTAGVLRFITAPDFENPTDANADNDYKVQVTVNDGQGQTTTQNITVTVTNANEPPALAGGSGTVTYKKIQTAVTVMPNVTVQSGVGTASLGRIEISVFVPKKGSLADYVIPSSAAALGSAATSGPTDFRKAGGTLKITITLNNGVTDQQVQDFLRSIKFTSSKMDPAKGSLGRKIEVKVFNRDGSGTPSNVISTQILAKKK